MRELFSGAKFEDFNGNISQWDVSNVKNMSFMFYGSRFNGDISGWNVSCVKKMNYMFAKSKFTKNIEAWNVKNVEEMCGILTNCNAKNPYWTEYKNIKERRIALKNYKLKNKLENKLIINKEVKKNKI